MVQKRKKSFWKKIKEVSHKQLVVPLLNGMSDPIFSARGVMVGLAWAMTPLVGVQMTTVTITWAICKFFKYKFSLPIALAWTWVTNVFTMLPIYYVFYLTGKIMMGQWSNIDGFSKFSDLFKSVFMSSDISFWQSLVELTKDWAFAMFIGCIPYVILGGFGGYFGTLAWMKRKKKNAEK